MMVTDKEKQIQATGSQYRYHHTQTEESTSNLSCCKEHETTMEKYESNNLFYLLLFLKHVISTVYLY